QKKRLVMFALQLLDAVRRDAMVRDTFVAAVDRGEFDAPDAVRRVEQVALPGALAVVIVPLFVSAEAFVINLAGAEGSGAVAAKLRHQRDVLRDSRTPIDVVVIDARRRRPQSGLQRRP